MDIEEPSIPHDDNGKPDFKSPEFRASVNNYFLQLQETNARALATCALIGKTDFKDLTPELWAMISMNAEYMEIICGHVRQSLLHSGAFMDDQAVVDKIINIATSEIGEEGNT